MLSRRTAGAKLSSSTALFKAARSMVCGIQLSIVAGEGSARAAADVCTLNSRRAGQPNLHELAQAAAMIYDLRHMSMTRAAHASKRRSWEANFLGDGTKNSMYKCLPVGWAAHLFRLSLILGSSQTTDLPLPTWCSDLSSLCFAVTKTHQTLPTGPTHYDAPASKIDPDISDILIAMPVTLSDPCDASPKIPLTMILRNELYASSA